MSSRGRRRHHEALIAERALDVGDEHAAARRERVGCVEQRLAFDTAARNTRLGAQGELRPQAARAPAARHSSANRSRAGRTRESSARTCRSPAARARASGDCHSYAPVRRGSHALERRKLDADARRAHEIRIGVVAAELLRREAVHGASIARRRRRRRGNRATRRDRRPHAIRRTSFAPRSPLARRDRRSRTAPRPSPTRRCRICFETPPPSASPSTRFDAREIGHVAGRERRALRALRARARARAARASACTRWMSGSVTARTSGGSESSIAPSTDTARVPRGGACTISGPVKIDGGKPEVEPIVTDLPSPADDPAHRIVEPFAVAPDLDLLAARQPDSVPATRRFSSTIDSSSSALSINAARVKLTFMRTTSRRRRIEIERADDPRLAVVLRPDLELVHADALRARADREAVGEREVVQRGPRAARAGAARRAPRRPRRCE